MSTRFVLPSDRQQWHFMRQSFITASVAGAVLNCHPYTTAYQLWALKTERVQPDDQENEAMRRGRLLEPAAVQMLREERPDWSIDYRADNAFFCDDSIRIGATPDAFAVRPDIAGPGIVQFKTASEEAFRKSWLDPETGEVEIPLWIAVQAIVEAKLTKSAWAAVAVMVVGRGIRMEAIDIPLLSGVWDALIAGVETFWAVVDSGEHPPIDWDRDGSTVLAVNRFATAKKIDLSGDPQFEVFASKLEDTREQRRRIVKLEELLRAQILYAMADAEVAETGRFSVFAPTTRRADGGVQRTIRVKLKDQSNGRF